MTNTSANRTPNQPGIRLVLVAILMALAAAACASTDSVESAVQLGEVDDQTAAPTPEPTEAPAPTEAPEPMDEQEAEPEEEVLTEEVVASENPAADRLDWILAVMLNDPAPDAEQVAAGFDDSFLAIVPIEQIMGLLPQLNFEATGDWTVTRTEMNGDTGMAVIEAPGSTGLNIRIGVDPEAPHKIVELLFNPVVEVPEVETLDDYEAALTAMAPTARVGIFEITDGSCSTVLDFGAEETMPVGSIFKLWILAELAHQVESGEASWDEVMPVEDRYKASPDGTIFNMAEGTEVTLLTYAEEMISISDNGATDHLLHRLGRSRVEAAMTASGVENPELNIPFLSAAELFTIKFHPDGPNSDDYRALDVDGRRVMLDEIKDSVVPWIDGPDAFPLTNADGVGLSQPRDHDLEWFATPADICRTHAYLAELATRPGLEPVADILSINATAGMEFDPEVWTDLRYKGGSEQGIVAVAWWMERADGRVFVLAGNLENEIAPLNAVDGVAVLQQGVNLIDQLAG